MPSRRKKADADCVYNSVVKAGIVCGGNAHGPNRALQAPQIPSCVKGSFTLSKHQEDHVALGFSKGRGQRRRLDLRRCSMARSDRERCSTLLNGGPYAA